jgi:amino acid transporter
LDASDLYEEMLMGETGTPPNAADGAADGLQAHAVGLWGDVVASVTTLSPTAGIALAMAALVAASGYASPLAILIAGGINLCCAIGVYRLGRLGEAAAAPVLWVRRLSPILGFATGVLLVMLTIVANIGNITVLGSTVLGTISSSLATHKPLVWVTAAAITALITYIAIKGVRLTVRAQAVVAMLEYTIVLILVIIAFVHATSAAGPGYAHPTWAWLTGSGTSFNSLLAGIVVGTFFLGGWDAPIYLGEEQQRGGDPGRSVVISIVGSTIWLTILIFAFQGLASPAMMSGHAANLLPFLASRAHAGIFTTLAAIAVVLALGTTMQGQEVDGSRVAYGMARARLLPQMFARTHRTFRTPSWGLLIGACIPVLALIFYLSNGGAGTAVQNVASSGGLMFGTYYAWLSLYAAWVYRRDLLRLSGATLATVVPLVGSGAFIFAIVRSVPSQTTAVLVLWLVLSFVGVPLAFVARRLTRGDFFGSGLVHGAMPNAASREPRRTSQAELTAPVDGPVAAARVGE